MIKNWYLLIFLVKVCIKFINYYKIEMSFYKFCLDLGCLFYLFKLILDNIRKRLLRFFNYDNLKLYVLIIENCD